MLKTALSRSDGSKHITHAAAAMPRRSQNSRMAIHARLLNEARCRTAAAGCDVVRLQSDLKHRDLDHTVFDIATRESGTSDPLELGTISVKIAEGLILPPKRLEAAHLPNRTDRQHEINRLLLTRRNVRHDQDTLEHGVHLLQQNWTGAVYCRTESPQHNG